MSTRQLETHTGPRTAALGGEVLPYARMKQVVETKTDEYSTAHPFPHIVIDNFFEPEVLERVLDDFPDMTRDVWAPHDNAREIKLQSKGEQAIPYYTRQLLYAMNSFGFLQFLETLTGIKKLVGDPQYEGGGLHQILPGGRLGIHADFNKHPYYDLGRRINVIVYLNKNWKDEYGGHLELWDKAMTKAEKVIAPIFNRMVIFNTTSNSFHGHPNPLACLPGMSRKSLALYYYTIMTTEDLQEARHTTLFQPRPGEQFRRSARQLARDWTPPALWRRIDRPDNK